MASDDSPETRNRRHWLVGALLTLTLALTWFAYQPGLSSSYYFDDIPNLAGLESTDNLSSALEFIVSGNAGPLGRPVALASFLIDGSNWPENPSGLRLTNTLIHTFNGLLVTLLAFLLARARKTPLTPAVFLSLTAGSLWLLLPILASTSMMIVQRMTSLSALFVLIGLNLFVLFHQATRRTPAFVISGLSLTLAMLTLLATLSKENGALLPLYALVVSGFIKSPHSLTSNQWRVWSALFLWLPVLAIFSFLVFRLPYSESTLLLRDFSGTERLLTQCKILWQYLFNAFIPVSTAALGPFHDNYPISRLLLEPLTLLATVSWVAVIALAVIARRSLPVLSFAVFWYVGGHLLESTVLPLDLYFEHRNYLPLIGPIFALAWIAVHVPRKWRTFSAVVISTYIGLMALTTWETTRSWGNPIQFAEDQYRHNRDSARAAGFFASHLLVIGQQEAAIMIIEQAIEGATDSERLTLSKIYLECTSEQERNPRVNIEFIRKLLAGAGPDKNLARGLHGIVEISLSKGCPSEKTESLNQWIDALATNPRFVKHSESQYWLHRSRALLARNQKNRNEQKRQLWLSQQARFEPIALEALIDLYIEDGEYNIACRRLQKLWGGRPRNPIKQLQYHLVINRLIDKAESYTDKSIQCNR